MEDFPACQCRGHWFDPRSGKIPHATEQLSLCTTNTKATDNNSWAALLQLLRLMCLESEKPVLYNEDSVQTKNKQKFLNKLFFLKEQGMDFKKIW